MIALSAVADSSRRHELRDATSLALVPLGVALVLGLLLVPWRAAPQDVPLPIPDRAALARAERADEELAAEARREPLAGAIRALGSAIRDFHTLEAHDGPAPALGEAKRAVDLAFIDALSSGGAGLLRLRAVQLEAFLVEVQRWVATKQPSAELEALAGGFVRSMSTEGWWDGVTLAPPTPALRVLFKHMWNAFLGIEGSDNAALGSPGRSTHFEEFAPTLDEERALYAFYLSHPRMSKPMREAIASARRGAHDDQACHAIAEAERSARETWRLERIGRLAVLDPAYPADYARGVARFRRGEYMAAAESFRKWLDEHPDGPLVLRARSYLRAAADALRD